MKSLLLATAITVFPFIAIAASHSAMPKPVVVAMKGTSDADHGTVTLTQMDDVVLLHADMKNMPEGGHGFHIHETGKCSPNFDAAGGHFNPKGKDHGFSGDGPHAGDMANIYAMADGTILADVLNPRISLFLDSDITLFDDDGSAVMVHAKPDSYGTKAGVGDRIACGVIER